MAIRVVKQPELTIAEFILQYLGKHREAYVHEMLNAFNNQSSRKQMKYTSFRTIVWNLKEDGYITLARQEDTGRGYPRSYYRPTGKSYEKGVRGRPREK